MINTPCHHLPVLDHWTGTVLYILLTIYCLAMAIRDFVKRQWTEAIRDASGALGFACISVSNGPHLPVSWLVGMFFCTVAVGTELRIRLAKRKKHSAA